MILMICFFAKFSNDTENRNQEVRRRERVEKVEVAERLQRRHQKKWNYYERRKKLWKVMVAMHPLLKMTK